jgi:hypothetical protein
MCKKADFVGENILPDSRIQLVWSIPVELESFFKHMTITPERKVKDDLVVQKQDEKYLVYLDFDPPLAETNRSLFLFEMAFCLFPVIFLPKNLTKSLFRHCPIPVLDLSIKREIQSNLLKSIRTGLLPLTFVHLCNGGMRKTKKRSTFPILYEIIWCFLLGHRMMKQKFLAADRSARFGFRPDPGTEFDVFLREGITDVFGQPVPTNTLSAKVIVRDHAPLLFPMTRGGMRGLYDSDQPTGVFFSARNVENVNVTTCEVPLETVRKIEGNGGWEWYDFSCASQGNNIQTSTQSVPGEKNETVVFEVPLPKPNDLRTVFFWEVSAPEVKSPWNDSVRVFRGRLFWQMLP